MFHKGVSEPNPVDVQWSEERDFFGGEAEVYGGFSGSGMEKIDAFDLIRCWKALRFSNLRICKGLAWRRLNGTQ